MGRLLLTRHVQRRPGGHWLIFRPFAELDKNGGYDWFLMLVSTDHRSPKFEEIQTDWSVRPWKKLKKTQENVKNCHCIKYLFIPL